MDGFGVVTEPGALRLERLLPGPVERIWAYLTEPEKRRKWLAGGAMELRPGGRMELAFRHSEITAEPYPDCYKAMEKGVTSVGRVLACDPPRLLTITWEDGTDRESEVTFELTPAGEKVLLVVTHRRLPDRATMVRVAGGWHAHLGLLEDLLAGDAPRPFWATHAALSAEYERRIPPAG